MRCLELETLAEFDQRVLTAASMRDWQLQGLDLRERSDVLLRAQVAGAVFLGCTLTQEVEDRLRERGALIFPRIPDVPFEPWRATLYSPAELYAGLADGYDTTPDARIYRYYRGVTAGIRPPMVRDELAMSVHDNSVNDALADLLADRRHEERVVGVMGGHAVRRGDVNYTAAAHLGQALAQAGYLVATGGGPGAMEAANLGALLSPATLVQLDGAIDRAATVPEFAGAIGDWAQAGFVAIEGLPTGDRSIGVPTWFYGHEPPNPFATQVAKFFHNALREDVLLRLCDGGVVFLPGAAGTVQEVFQAACVNYYAAPGDVVPMVFVGRDYWTQTLPVWPLLETLAGDRDFSRALALVDSVTEVLPALGALTQRPQTP